MEYYIKADRFLLESEEKIGGYLLVENGRFGNFVNKVPVCAVVEDWTGYTVAPGLFDTHIHGIKNYDVMDGTVKAVQEISAILPELGVTRFLPTTLTSSKHDLQKAILAVKEGIDKGLPGAKSEGIFLEGPYFTNKHKGAQNPAFFRNPSYEEFTEWQQLADGMIVKVALAPERPGSIDFIEKVSKENVFISIAHTDASYECCRNAIKAGATIFVHLFNGMSGLHHRKPGAVGAALLNNQTYTEIICDGFHVHPHMANLAFQIKEEKLVLITDCMRAGLMPDGDYSLGDFQVKMNNNIARTVTGSLAGSTLTLIDGVKNFYKWSRKGLHIVWHLASLSPANSIGKGNQLGSISPGKLADYVVIDENFEVQMTAITGEIIYKRLNI
ncbi:N-acetylglucosamine-6-phosphate deacetylase [Pseudogracilibacillus sp. SE30717A]|uniref:N-acetylglucosamine-6-phosphate deacetylase n=1 Tax=Pseudogracilibacillus sp. SE30717A TaxID=3098293 RepID=UPI00300E454A